MVRHCYPAGAGVLAALMTLWGTLEQAAPEGLHPMEGAHDGAGDKRDKSSPGGGSSSRNI